MSQSRVFWLLWGGGRVTGHSAHGVPFQLPSSTHQLEQSSCPLCLGQVHSSLPPPRPGFLHLAHLRSFIPSPDPRGKIFGPVPLVSQVAQVSECLPRAAPRVSTSPGGGLTHIPSWSRSLMIQKPRVNPALQGTASASPGPL